MEPSYFKSDTHKASKPGPLARLKRLFSPDSLDDLRLSPPSVSDRKEAPSVTTLMSREGARTCLSIERTHNPPPGIREETRFCAVHNTVDGARHTLQYKFQESSSGEIIITGDISELGAQSVVPYTAVSFVNTMLVEFGLFGTNDSKRELVRLRQAAFRLVECFTEDGYEGVLQYLEDDEALPKGEQDWLLYGKRVQSDRTGIAETEELEVAFVDRKTQRSLGPSELANLERICEALEAIETLSHEQHEFLRNQAIDLGIQDDTTSRRDEEDLEYYRQKLREYSEVNKKLPFGRHWVRFITPSVPRDSSVMFSLQLPFSRAPKSDDLQGLLIELQGPKRLGFFRETYRMVDIGNVMDISPYGNNGEFLRNLFRELHAVNRSYLENEKKIIHVLDLLEAYGIEMKPYGVFTRLNHWWRNMYFFVSDQLHRFFERV